MIEGIKCFVLLTLLSTIMIVKILESVTITVEQILAGEVLKSSLTTISAISFVDLSIVVSAAVETSEWVTAVNAAGNSDV